MLLWVFFLIKYLAIVSFHVCHVCYLITALLTLTFVPGSQRRDEGHSSGDDLYPALCQLPGFCLDVSYFEINRI